LDTALRNFSGRQSPADDGKCRANGSDGTGTEQSTKHRGFESVGDEKK